MRWWKRRYHRNRAQHLSQIWAWGLGLFVCLSPLPAQQTLEQRYEQALDDFNNAKMEEACDLFQQVEKESPGYKEIRTYLNPSCAVAKHLYDLEEQLFNEGVDLFKKGSYDDAKQKLEQARRIGLKSPKYRAQIASYLGEIDSRQRDEALFQEAVDLFNKGQDDEAEARFTRLAKSGGPRSAEANSYLQRIAGRRQEIPFDAAVAAFTARRYEEARASFDSIAKSGGSKAGEARDFLQRIEAARMQEASVREAVAKAQAGKDPLQVSRQYYADAQAAIRAADYQSAIEKLRVVAALDPGNKAAHLLLVQVEQQAGARMLRAALKAYFEGHYDEAERGLSDYIIGRGPRQALAYFFRGAVHATAYFLSDEQDTEEKQKAFSDFRATQKDGQQFRPPKELASPKLLAFYAESIKGGMAPDAATPRETQVK